MGETWREFCLSMIGAGVLLSAGALISIDQQISKLKPEQKPEQKVECYEGINVGWDPEKKEKFCDINGQRYFIEIDEEPVGRDYK